MVDDYISRKQGKTEVKYDLPQLAPILGDTYGGIAYQEQVMRIAAVLAGFTMGQSDMLRKAMGKKDPRSWRSSARPSWRGPGPRGSTKRRPPRFST
jgi:DNA polymerase-3 subunit alpha